MRRFGARDLCAPRIAAGRLGNRTGPPLSSDGTVQLHLLFVKRCVAFDHRLHAETPFGQCPPRLAEFACVQRFASQTLQ